MALDLNQYNEAVRNWDIQSNQDVKTRAGGYGITHRNNSPSPGSSVNKFRSKLFLRAGQIVHISKTFPREVIWVHKGAGKGRGGTKGSRWTDKYGNKKKTKPSSLGKMGTDGRTAKPFVNDSLEGPAGVETLATIAAEYLGDALTGSLFIK